jgi:hypothetical protein
MSQLSYEPEHLRNLASALRSEADLIKRHNHVLQRLEADTGVFFPVEKSTNTSRVENLNEAADLLEALAEKK